MIRLAEPASQGQAVAARFTWERGDHLQRLDHAVKNLRRAGEDPLADQPRVASPQEKHG